MDEQSYRRFVAGNELFLLLDEPARQRVMELGVVEKHPAGVELIRQGAFDSDVFLLRSGNVEVRVEEQGIIVPVEQLGPGAIFGEVATAKGVARTATVVTSSEVEVLRFPGRRLVELLRENPSAARLLEKIIDDRAKDTLAETYGY